MYSSTLGQVPAGPLEEQTIAMHPLEGTTLEGGTFRLSFNAHGQNDFDSITDTVTEPINFDATATEMQTALQQLSNVATVQVRRTGSYRVQLCDRCITNFDTNTNVLTQVAAEACTSPDGAGK